MTPSPRRTAPLAALALALSACVTTPLPLPPSMDPNQVKAEASDGGEPVLVWGGPGAFDQGGFGLRVTAVEEPTWGSPPEHGETAVGEDGSFAVTLLGSDTATYYFEALLEDEDLFLLAADLDGRDLVVVDPGPDRDGDGSPDAIDCAPDDETVGGRRCE